MSAYTELFDATYPLFHASGPELIAHPNQAAARFEAMFRDNAKVRAHFELAGKSIARPTVSVPKTTPTPKAPKAQATPKKSTGARGGSLAFWQGSLRTAQAHVDALVGAGK